MIPEDVVTEGLAQFTERYREGPEELQPNLDALARVFLGRLQTLEDALAAYAVQLRFSTSTGVWLDRIYGRMFNLRRQPGWDDDEYRFYLRTKMMALRSHGLPDELIRLMHRFTPEGTDIDQVLLEYPDNMHVQVQIPFIGTSTTLATQLLDEAAMAGVNTTLVTYDPLLTGGWDSVEGGVYQAGSFGSVAGEAYAYSLFSHIEDT